MFFTLSALNLDFNIVSCELAHWSPWGKIHPFPVA